MRKGVIIRIFVFILFTSTLNSQHIEFSKEDSAWAKKIFQQLSLKQKIAQLFTVDISAKIDNTAKKKKVLEWIKKYQIGGVIIMKSDYSLTSEWIRDFQKASDVPLLISTDGEWGINMRISGTTKFPYELTLGALAEDSLLFEMGKAIGKDCRRLGIHVNFAPVADVNINPKNPVINYRSFGENKYRVAQKCIHYAMGLQSEGVMACAKHFPGHGDTDADSHEELPVIKKPKEILDELELFPFGRLIDANIWSIMVAHLKVPALDSSGIASSLSRPVITQLLKEEMGFEGLVFSDALNMKGASVGTASGDMELEAYKAGNHVLLMSENIEQGIKRIESYIKQGSIVEQKELDERIFKLLLFKHKLNTPQIAPLVYSPEESYNDVLSSLIYKKSLTFISADRTSEEPIIQKNKSTVLVSLDESPSEFGKMMESFAGFSFVRLSKNASAEEFKKLAEDLSNFEQILVSYQDLSQNEKNNFGLTDKQISFIQQIGRYKNVIHLWFGNPYGLKYFQSAKNVMVAYEDNPRVHKAVFQSLYSNEKLYGKLPVSVGKFKEGASYINYKTSNTADYVPQTHVTSDHVDEGLIDKASILNRIETICQEIVSNGVAPGGQIYVLYKGKEIYNRAFGYQTYSPNSSAVKTSDIYDLASVSKIMGTTLAVMKLQDLGKLNINDKVGDYLTLDDSNTIADIPLRQLLVHEAGLTPFIPFYQRFNDSNFYDYFRTKATFGFTTKVADNLYIRDDYKDTMWFETIHNKRTGIGKYKYSDLSMYIMQRVVESVAGTTLDQYLYKNFYKPLGIGLCYNPTEKYSISRIAPTELDTKFRLQQVHGYVHDQGCSLYGGVCGHAGLFGNAADVAKVMQMLLQGGTFNKKSYIKPETITLFTSQQNINSRRGLGFDKPNVDDLSASPTALECSFATFGHTGFTGTCAWADPFSELVFVFLSNRVYPNADNKKLAKGNYRERLQSLFYQYIKTQ